MAEKQIFSGRVDNHLHVVMAEGNQWLTVAMLAITLPFNNPKIVLFYYDFIDIVLQVGKLFYQFVFDCFLDT